MAHLSDIQLSQWALGTCSRLMKKGRKVARMVSAFKETRERGFGLRISKNQFVGYNANRV